MMYKVRLLKGWFSMTGVNFNDYLGYTGGTNFYHSASVGVPFMGVGIPPQTNTYDKSTIIASKRKADKEVATTVGVVGALGAAILGGLYLKKNGAKAAAAFKNAKNGLKNIFKKGTPAAPTAAAAPTSATKAPSVMKEFETIGSKGAGAVKTVTKENILAATHGGNPSDYVSRLASKPGNPISVVPTPVNTNAVVPYVAGPKAVTPAASNVAGQKLLPYTQPSVVANASNAAEQKLLTYTAPISLANAPKVHPSVINANAINAYAAQQKGGQKLLTYTAPATAAADKVVPSYSQVLIDADKQIAKDLNKEYAAMRRRIAPAAHARKQAQYDALFAQPSTVPQYLKEFEKLGVSAPKVALDAKPQDRLKIYEKALKKAKAQVAKNAQNPVAKVAKLSSERNDYLQKLIKEANNQGVYIEPSYKGEKLISYLEDQLKQYPIC